MAVMSQQVIIASVGAGLKLLPFLVRSIEALFGKKTGETKKAAAQELFNAAALGTAVGFGLAGDQKTSDMVNLFRPVVSATIDELAAQLFPTHSPADIPEQPATVDGAK